MKAPVLWEEGGGSSSMEIKKPFLPIFHRVGSSFVLCRVNFQIGADDKTEICG